MYAYICTSSISSSFYLTVTYYIYVHTYTHIYTYIHVHTYAFAHTQRNAQLAKAANAALADWQAYQDPKTNSLFWVNHKTKKITFDPPACVSMYMPVYACMYTYTCAVYTHLYTDVYPQMVLYVCEYVYVDVCCVCM
jgi:hypothetical protein